MTFSVELLLVECPLEELLVRLTGQHTVVQARVGPEYRPYNNTQSWAFATFFPNRYSATSMQLFAIATPLPVLI
jgi:hypothetical protein